LADTQLPGAGLAESQLQRVHIRYRHFDQGSGYRKTRSEFGQKARQRVARFPVGKARLTRLAGRGIAHYVDLVYRTSRVVSEPADLRTFVRSHSPFILAMWHGQFLMLPRVERGELRVHSMVARHGDAELIGQVLERFGMDMIRGAGAGTRRRNRGGAYALRAALRALKRGDCVAMT